MGLAIGWCSSSLVQLESKGKMKQSIKKNVLYGLYITMALRVSTKYEFYKRDLSSVGIGAF